jgi:FKBP12-rapamycin complex-associated protein
MLSHVLMHKPLRHPGMPRHLVASSTGSAVTLLSSHGLGLESQDVSSIVLALRTLGSFNFDGNATLWH